MNKDITLFVISFLLVAVSCGFLRKNGDLTPQQDYKGGLAEHVEAQPSEIKNPVFQDQVEIVSKPKDKTKPDNPETKPQKVITHYDSVSLDQQVRIEASKMKKDPETYRMLVRIDPDGAKIYRQIGMHVIVAPGNEDVFLPDEI